MSIHPSLRGVDTLRGERSVFTRIERLQKLLHEGKLQGEDSPYGLPKVRTSFKIKTAKKAKAEGEDEENKGEENKGEESKDDE